MTGTLFEATEGAVELLGPGAVLLRGFAVGQGAAVVAGVHEVIVQAPLRQMLTPGGLQMSVAMTNCGALGWVSDRGGYRYAALDPTSGKPWPVMPEVFATLAADAAEVAGFANFEPDVCL